MREIILHGDKAAGRVALVDDADYDRVNAYRWHIYENPSISSGPYAETTLSRRVGHKNVRMHTLITGRPGVDHCDGNGLNNQRYNLREATAIQNTWNTRSHRDARSRYKGVSWKSSSKKWRSRIRFAGVETNLGVFDVEEDAARAYDAAARENFGEFARLNFPDLSGVGT